MSSMNHRLNSYPSSWPQVIALVITRLRTCFIDLNSQIKYNYRRKSHSGLKARPKWTSGRLVNLPAFEMQHSHAH
jgi:hypothetical protein